MFRSVDGPRRSEPHSPSSKRILGKGYAAPGIARSNSHSVGNLALGFLWNGVTAMKTTTVPVLTRSPIPAAPWAPRLAICLLLTGAVSNRAQAAETWMFATPEVLPAPINVPARPSLAPWLSPDGLRLYFTSDRQGGYGSYDLWMVERSSMDAEWGFAMNLGPTINTAAPDGLPFLSSDELTLYFGDVHPDVVPGRNGSTTDSQIWIATRPTRQSPWNPPTVVGPPVDSSIEEGSPNLSPDGLSMYFFRGSNGQSAFFVAQRNSLTEPWLPPTRLPSIMNQANWNIFPFVSADARYLFFESNRSGGRGVSDLWMATRATSEDPWTNAPVNLGTQVNTPFLESSPWVSADFPALGSFLLFARNNSPNLEYGSSRIFRAEVIPNLTVLRANSLDQASPWTPTTATFTKVSANAIQSEVTISASTEAYYRVNLAGDGTVHIESTERVGNKVRLRYTWTE